MTRTREQERIRKGRYRARKREKEQADSGAVMPGAVVLQLPPPKPPSDVVDAVRDELAGLPGAALHPGLTASAIAMAKILDNEAARPHHAAAARSLGAILQQLHAKGGSDRGKLAVMRATRRE